MRRPRGPRPPAAGGRLLPGPVLSGLLLVAAAAYSEGGTGPPVAESLGILPGQEAPAHDLFARLP